MQIALVPSSVAGRGQPLTSYLINGTLAIDAGCVGLAGAVADQEKIEHVFLSHSHIDHVASLPMLIENGYAARRGGLAVYGNEETLDCLRRDLFNDRLWPDLLALTTPETPFLRLEPIEAGRPVELAGLRITTVEVDHTVPTLGFIVEEGGSAVVIASDTGPTEEIWRHARGLVGLRAVFLEASFPDDLASLAELTGHLTPAGFAREIRKLGRSVPAVAVHIKPRYYEQVVAELEALGLGGLEIGRPGETYRY